jgi:hypothetical protein
MREWNEISIAYISKCYHKRHVATAAILIIVTGLINYAALSTERTCNFDGFVVSLDVFQ